MEIGIEWRLLISYPFSTEQETYAEIATLFSPLCLTQKSIPAAQDIHRKLIPTPDPEGWPDGGIPLPLHDSTEVLQVSGDVYTSSWTEA